MTSQAFPLAPNRVWRSYLGGRNLDVLSEIAPAADTHFPEDWIASATAATNPSDSGGPGGISNVTVGSTVYALDRLIAQDPVYFLGEAHVACYGAEPRILVKYIDCAIRLHLQVHPSAAFARRYLNSPVGKTEAYHVLGCRDSEACVYLGFRREVRPEELKILIEQQKIEELLASLNKVPVQPGDTLLVPGGTPHALGEGLFLVELQEASDLVVRFEFKRGGFILPEASRFMGHTLDFCLGVFDYRVLSPSQIDREFRCQPEPLHKSPPASWAEELIGSSHTRSFRLQKLHLGAPLEYGISEFAICIVLRGALTVESKSATFVTQQFGKFLLPAGLGKVRLSPRQEPEAELLVCLPPSPHS